MDIQDYQKACLTTESNDFPAIKGRVTDENIRLLHAGIGLATEAGEFLDALKKHVFYGKDLDKVNLMEECGDLMWYMSVALDALGYDFEKVMERNIEKLSARYKGGFSKNAAVNRDLDTERDILEKTH
jgi:NTP pyrophosphatase (non-canonical NTP hydrolase)